MCISSLFGGSLLVRCCSICFCIKIWAILLFDLGSFLGSAWAAALSASSELTVVSVGDGVHPCTVSTSDSNSSVCSCRFGRRRPSSRSPRSPCSRSLSWSWSAPISTRPLARRKSGAARPELNFRLEPDKILLDGGLVRVVDLDAGVRTRGLGRARGGRVASVAAVGHRARQQYVAQHAQIGCVRNQILDLLFQLKFELHLLLIDELVHQVFVVFLLLQVNEIVEEGRVGLGVALGLGLFLSLGVHQLIQMF
ncbi:hypothetical protein BpHYR1_017247 [Brachionus plicatilis]|uniref:Uncharacterized protein n=1 Tax=Brachionus plicatilis TaxID=10195 RepID=A0A3M7SPN1_BRAPC|nr:hypothetical protein BpHYR1_017247 [Brachionus plicatilis]